MRKTLALVLVLAGCSGPMDVPDSVETRTRAFVGAPPLPEPAPVPSPDPSPAPSPTPSAQYPAGPYGRALNSVVPNLTFQGYYVRPDANLTNATAASYGSFTLDDIRTSGAKYLLLYSGSFSCGACVYKASQLAHRADDLEANQIAALGVGVAYGDVQDREDLDRQLSRYPRPYSYALDTTTVRGGLSAVFDDPYSAWGVTYTIRLSDMKIVAWVYGDVDGAVDRAIAMAGN